MPDRPCLPVYKDRKDYTVFENGRPIGRLYEDNETLPELRWFWSITEFVDRRVGAMTHGRVPPFEDAKAQLSTNWRKAIGSNPLPSSDEPPRSPDPLA